MRIQTVQQLISVWKDIATRHYQINGFGIGDDWEVGASEAKMHPVLWINPVSATMPESEFAGYKTFEIDFEIKVFDLVNKDETNENEVLSDTIDILKDCITELKGHPYYTNSQLDIVDDITFEPFTEEFDEEVSGWSAEITFKSPVLRSWCGLPMEDITGFEFPGNDCPDVNVLCPVFVQDVIGTYPIIVTNGNDSTKIVSIDQDALVDTYVTGQTFSGNNLQTTLNNGDIINTDINDFDSLNVNGTIIATTYNGDGSNLTGIDSTNIYNTSNSLTDNRIVDLDSNTLSFDGDGGNIAIYNPDGLATLTSDNSNIFNARSRDGIKGIELYDNISVIGTNGLRITDDLGAINNFQSFKSTPDRLISRKFTGGKDHYYFRYTPLNSRFLVFPDGILGDGVNIGGDTSLGCANISLHDDTTIGGKLTFGIDTTETSDGCLIDDSLSFHINGTDELAGRYKDNLGVVRDLVIGSATITGGSYSVPDLTLNDSNGGSIVIPNITGENIGNTDLTLSDNRTLDFNGNNFLLENTANINTASIRILNGQGLSVNRESGSGTMVVKRAGVNKMTIGSTTDWWASNTIIIGQDSTTNGGLRFRKGPNDISYFDNTGVIQHLTSNLIQQFFRFGFSAGEKLIIGSTTDLLNEDISLQGETTISDQFVQHVASTATVDGDLIDDSLSLHINNTNELAGRYKDNLGVVRDLAINENIFNTNLTLGASRTHDMDGNSISYVEGQHSFGVPIGGNQSKVQIVDDGSPTYTNLLQLKNSFNANVFRINPNGNILTMDKQGWTGTFTNGDGDTVTVTNGLITNVV